VTTPVGDRVLMLLENESYQFDTRPMLEARTLTRAGYCVSVICPRLPGGKVYEILDGVHLYQFPAPPAADGFLGYLWEYGYSLAATFAFSLVVYLHKGLDIIHAHNPPDLFFLVAAFYRLLGKRFVFDHHDLSPEMYSAHFGEDGSRAIYSALVLLERLSCRLADRVIATNESYKAVEMARGGVREERITIVRNGPDLESLELVRPDPGLGQKAGTILGYVGVIGYQDGVDYLLRALHHLVFDLNRHDILCIVIGDGPALSELRLLARELRVEEQVWFTGWVSDQDLIRCYLAAATICVVPDPSNPYNDRSTMMKIAEYMALGKPTVAFDLPEHRVTAQDAALYARPNDELDFALRIASLMDDPEQRKKMGRIGRERIETKLAWPHQERALLTVYEDLATQIGRRRQ
jgi:glycosyltransferase involved in cell wall biosynthesis